VAFFLRPSGRSEAQLLAQMRARTLGISLGMRIFLSAPQRAAATSVESAALPDLAVFNQKTWQ